MCILLYFSQGWMWRPINGGGIQAPDLGSWVLGSVFPTAQGDDAPDLPVPGLSRRSHLRLHLRLLAFLRGQGHRPGAQPEATVLGHRPLRFINARRVVVHPLPGNSTHGAQTRIATVSWIIYHIKPTAWIPCQKYADQDWSWPSKIVDLPLCVSQKCTKLLCAFSFFTMKWMQPFLPETQILHGSLNI